MHSLVFDLLISLPLFALILFTILFTSRLKNRWRNRKYIHLSSIPAVVAYMYWFKEPFLFFAFSISFFFILLFKHRRNRISNWFQERKNFGEVWFTLSFALLSLVFWPINREIGGLIMLFMALGDGLTGIVRSFFVKKREKHLSGTIVMFFISSILAYSFLGFYGILLAFIATLSEHQKRIDDNIAVPLFTSLTYLVLHFL